MLTKTPTGARALLGAAAIACTLFAGSVAASDQNVTIAMDVSSKGLDLNQPDDAQTFYTRIENAARVVCTHGNRVDLTPLTYPKGCYEKALGDAIRAANMPSLTQIYLTSHTLREAATYGIKSVQVAVK